MSAPGSDPRFAKLVRDFVALATEHSEQLTGADDVKENLNVAIGCLTHSFNLGASTPENLANARKLLDNYDSTPADDDLKCDPTKALALKDEGNVFWKQGKHQEAYEKYSEALKYDTTNAAIYFNRGLCDFAMKEYTKAESDLKQAILIKPDHARAHNKLSQVYVELGDKKAALESAKRALDFESTNEHFKKHVETLESSAESAATNGAAPGGNRFAGMDMGNMMQQAQEAMQNPQFRSMIDGLMGNMDENTRNEMMSMFANAGAGGAAPPRS